MPPSAAGVPCQQLCECGGSGRGWCAGPCCLELQNALTQLLQGCDASLNTGEGLPQVCFQQGRFTWMLKIATNKCSNLFEGQSEGPQALDHLHTPDRFLSKQAVVALTATQGIEESKVFIVAQKIDRHTSPLGELPDGHRM